MDHGEVAIGYAELSQMGLPSDSKLYADLERIRRAAERAASLTKQILAFSRRQVLEIRAYNLNDVIAEFQEMLRRMIREDIELQIALAESPCPVKADKAQIEQLLMNLSVNARDAMPNGGKLTIETDNVFLDEIFAQKYSETLPGHYVMLSLSDTGHGMDSETQEHIFEPFFTTKPQGRGTGLGLSTVYGIVEQNNGFIDVNSEPGKGTTFRIFLPRYDASSLGIEMDAANQSWQVKRQSWEMDAERHRISRFI